MIGATSGLLAALVAAPAPPVDAAAPFELAWRAPPGCPDAAALRRRLAALAPVRPDTPTGLRAEGLVARAPDGAWRLRLALHGPGLDDTRTITAADCNILADVAALLLAIAVAPTSVAGSLVPAPAIVAAPTSARDDTTTPPVAPTSARDNTTTQPVAPASARDNTTIPPVASTSAGNNTAIPPVASTSARNDASTPPVAPTSARDDASTSPALPLEPREPDDVAAPPEPRARRSAAPPLSRKLTGAVRVAGGAEVGAIARWSPTASLAAALLGPGWRVEIAGSYSARDLTYAELPAVGGRLLLAAGALRGCGVPRWRRLEFPVCAGLELGLLRGVARGVREPRAARDLWIAAQLSTGAAWVPHPRLALVLGLELSIALRRPGFHVAGLGELARSQPIGLRPTLGVELRFP